MVIGRQSISLRKKSVSESKLPTVGVKTLSFAHQAPLDAMVIPFESLIEPAAWANAGQFGGRYFSNSTSNANKYVGYAGGNETRPKNVAMYFIIRY